MIITAVCQAQMGETEHVAAERGLEHKRIELLLVCGFHMQMASKANSSVSYSYVSVCGRFTVKANFNFNLAEKNNQKEHLFNNQHSNK